MQRYGKIHNIAVNCPRIGILHQTLCARRRNCTPCWQEERDLKSMEKGAVRPRGPTAPTLLPACAHQDKAANVRLLAQIAFIVAAAFVGVIGSGLDVPSYALSMI